MATAHTAKPPSLAVGTSLPRSAPSAAPAPLPDAPSERNGSDPASPDKNNLQHQAPVLEEDENTETGSEAVEPVTPTSDTHPHAFHHHDGADESVPPNMPVPPTSAPAEKTASNESSDEFTPVMTNASSKHAPPSRVSSGLAASSSEEAGSKPKLTKRVGSFMRHLGHRSKHAEQPQQQPQQQRAEAPAQNGTLEKQSTNTSLAAQSTADSSAPKTRRFSSWSLSARNSPSTSQTNSPPSHSPPSPSSPTSTIDETKSSGSRPGFGHKHSQSSSGLKDLRAPSGVRGLTWAVHTREHHGGSEHSPRRPFRRRSASSEAVAQMVRGHHHAAEDSDTQGLSATFSSRAAEGTGLKARRLSTSLPDEFQVDSCELDSEFKTPSSIPGRRTRIVGKGATATVKLMCRKGVDSSELFAVKQFRGRESSETEEEYLKKVKSEFTIANSLHHPNIVETVRLCTQNGRYNHVMEYCSVGELYTLVEKRLFQTHFKLEDRMCLFKQLLRGVDYLHSHGIAHRDIKLENLLLTQDGVLKISDFGVSEVFSGEHPGLRASGGVCGKNMGEVRRCAPGICGSMPYIAPEVLAKKGDYDPRPLDVWSCAIVFMTMTYGGAPWSAASKEGQGYARFQQGWDAWLAEHPDGVVRDEKGGFPKCGPLFDRLDSPAIRRLMLKMLHPLPEKRIGVAQALGSPIMRLVECCSPESYEERSGCVVDACKKGQAKSAAKMVQRKHSHLPPTEHRTPKFFQHRFDMGDGWS